MSDDSKSNTEIVNVLKIISDNWSRLMVIPSFFGIMFILSYLGSIERVEIFPQMSFSSPGILLILLFFILFSINLNLPFVVFRLLLVNDAKFREFVGDNKVLYVIAQPFLMLCILSSRLLYFSDELEPDGRFYLSIFIIILFFMLLLYFRFFNGSKFSENKKVIFIYSLLYALSAILFVFPLYIISEASGGLDQLFFCLVIIYLLFSIVSFWVALWDINLTAYLCALGMIYILLFIAIAKVGNGFKLQRMILKPTGIAQSQSQSGWYLLKNGDFLELIESNKYKKRVRTINERTYTYINGYLILNIGNIRVICPHDFETTDNQKANDQNLGFSRCLSLTSEDIKFMKRDYPNKNSKDASDESAALMVAETSMTIKNLMMMKNRMIMKNRMTVKDLMAVKNLITVKN